MIALAKHSKVEFDPHEHIYRLAGRIVPSVTEVIGCVLPGWQADDWYLQRGRSLHHGCALSDANTLDWLSVAPEISDRIRAWEKFRREWPAQIVACERSMASVRHQFAGTCDRVLFRDGKYTIADIKSTTESQVFLQIGGYSLLLKEDCDLTADSGVAVECRDDGTYRATWIDAFKLRRCEQQFLAALTVFYFAREHKLQTRGEHASVS